MSPVHGIIGHVPWPRFQSIRSWQLWLAACWRSVRTMPADVVEPKTSFEDLLVTVRKSCFCMFFVALWYGLRLQPRVSCRWPVRLSLLLSDIRVDSSRGVCGTLLIVDVVRRGTDGGLWYPLRDEARFEARVHPLQCNDPPPPTLHLWHAARSKHRYNHIRPEVVGWAPPV